MKTLLRVTVVLIPVLFCGCAAHSPAPLTKEPPVLAQGEEPAASSDSDSAKYLFTESQFRRKKGDLEGALQYLNQAIEQDPESLYLKRELVHLYWQNKDVKNAMAVLKMLLEEAPDDVENLILYARTSHVVKNMDAAKSAYEKILSLDPENKNTYLLLGGIYADEGNLVFARQIYRKLINQFPDYFAGYFVLGQTLAMEGNFYEAEKSFLKALELEPTLDDARYELIQLYKTFVKDDIVYTVAPGDTITGICLELYGGCDEKIKKAIVDANPYINNLSQIHAGQQIIFPRRSLQDDQGRHIGDQYKIIQYYKEILAGSPDDIRAAMGLGYFQHVMGKTGAAEKILTELGGRSQTDPEVIDHIVEYYLNEKEFDAAIVILEYMAKGAFEKSEINYVTALAYYGKGDKERAVQHLLEVGPDSRHYDKAVEHIFFMYTEDQKNSEAIAFLTTAIQNRPENSNFRLYVGKLYEETEAYDEAQAVLQEGLEIDPDNPKLLFLLGVILDKAGKKDDAIFAMKEVLRITPDDATALNYLGYTYADMGENLDEAEKLVKQALQYRPDDGYITDSLGWVYFQKGDYKKALAVLTRAVALVPDDPTILEHLGDAYLKLDNPKKALEMYRRSLTHSENPSDTIKKKVQDLVEQGH